MDEGDLWQAVDEQQGAIEERECGYRVLWTQENVDSLSGKREYPPLKENLLENNSDDDDDDAELTHTLSSSPSFVKVAPVKEYQKIRTTPFCKALIETAALIDSSCLQVTEFLDRILALCSSPAADINSADGLFTIPLLSKQQVFLWIIEEAVLKSFQVLESPREAKVWNARVKRKLKRCSKKFRRLHEAVSELLNIFLELEEQIILNLRRKINETLGETKNGAASLIGKYALKQCKEEIPLKNGNEGLESKNNVQNSKIRLQIRLSLGCLTLKTNRDNKWLKFESVGRQKDREDILNTIINNFVTVVSESQKILLEMEKHKNSCGSERMGRLFSKISEIICRRLKFLPKEQMLILKEWLRADIGFDFLLTKIKLLFETTDNLRHLTETLYWRNFKGQAGECGRSTVILDKYTSAQIEISGLAPSIDIIFDNYFEERKKLAVLLDAPFPVATESDASAMNETSADSVVGMIENSKAGVPSNSSQDCTEIMESMTSLAQCTNINEEYEDATENLYKNETIQDSYLGLCRDKIISVYEESVYLQRRIEEKNQTLHACISEIFIEEGSSLNKHLLTCLGVVFQILRRCHSEHFQWAEKFEFHRAMEELVHCNAVMQNARDEYRELFKKDRTALNDYIGDLCSVDKYSEHLLFVYRVPKRIQHQQSRKLQKPNTMERESTFIYNTQGNSGEYEGFCFKKENTQSLLQGVRDEAFNFARLKRILAPVPLVEEGEQASRPCYSQNHMALFTGKAHYKILCRALCPLKNVCRFTTRTFKSLSAQAGIQDILKNMANWLSPKKNFKKLHQFERLLVCRTLLSAEEKYKNHLIILDKFCDLVRGLTITVDFLQTFSVNQGIIESYSNAFKNEHLPPEWKEFRQQILLSEIGVEDYQTMRAAIEAVYAKRLSDAAAKMAVAHHKTSSMTRENTAYSTGSTIEKAYTKFTNGCCGVGDGNNFNKFKTIGIDPKQLFLKKLEIVHELVFGGLENILKILTGPKISQEFGDNDAPLGSIEILSFLICVTCKIFSFPKSAEKSIVKELKTEFLSVLSAIKAFNRSGEKAASYFNNEITSKITRRESSKIYRPFTKKQMKAIWEEIGEPSTTRILAEIWQSAEEQEKTMKEHEFKFKWNKSNDGKVICQSHDAEEIEFKEIEWENKIKFIKSFLRSVADSFRNMEMSILQFRENIRFCSSELKAIWKMDGTKDFKSWHYAMYLTLMKYISTKCLQCLQIMHQVGNEAFFFINYGYLHIFGSANQILKSSKRKLNPIACKGFSVHLKCQDVILRNKTELFDKDDFTEESYKIPRREITLRGNSPQEKFCIEIVEEILEKLFAAEELKANNGNAFISDQNMEVEEDQEKFANCKFCTKFELEHELVIEKVHVDLTGFDPILITVNRLDDLLNSALEQSYDLMNYPNASFETKFGGDDNIDIAYVLGLATLISKGSTELSNFVETTKNMITPIEKCHQNISMWLRWSFNGKKAHARQISKNLAQIQGGFNDFLVKIARKISNPEISQKLISMIEDFEKYTKDPMQFKQEINAKISNNFDFFKISQNRPIGLMWEVEWDMNNLGIVIKSIGSQEIRRLLNLPQENKLIILESIMKLLNSTLQMLTALMATVRRNSDNANNFFKNHFLKLANQILSNGKILVGDDKQGAQFFFQIMQHLQKIIIQSKFLINEMTWLADKVSRTMDETMNYIKMRLFLESPSEHLTLAQRNTLKSYRALYGKKVQQFHTDLLLRHNYPVSVQIVLDHLPNKQSNY